jgi:cytochrome c-type biogenesis protein CcsB
MKLLKRISDSLFSTTISGIYILVFALSIGAATFIENDFGTSSAQQVIFRSWWFEAVLLLFGISLLVNIFRFRMVQQKKWAILTFHAAFIIILLGSAVTRYLGSEGMMHIRKGNTSNAFLSSETYLQIEAQHEGKKFMIEEPAQFATLGNNDFSKSYLIGNKELKVEVLDFIPNPVETLVDDENGIPVLKIVIGGTDGREEYFLKYMDKVNVRGILFNFGYPRIDQAFNIYYENGQIIFNTNQVYSQMQMATQQRDTLLPGIDHPLLLRSLYSNGDQSFVIGDFNPRGKIMIISSSDKLSSTSMAGLVLKINMDDQEKNLYVFGSKGIEGVPGTFNMGNSSFAVSYGAKTVHLPFALKLNEFIMERYPGTNSASSYASEITLVDPRYNINRDQRIYMNHILNYGGFRFFQSSFDEDEQGTYLSVNHDRWGTWITYLGYTLLTVGMILTLISKKSRFSQLGKNIRSIRQNGLVISLAMILCLVSFSGSAFSPSSSQLSFKTVDPDHAADFGRLIVQDYNGRMKPINTFANEILRKISRKETLYGLSAEQVILGMALNPNDWYGIPLIKVGSNEEIRKLLGTHEEMVAYRDFFDTKGTYKLKDQVRNAYNTPQRDRGTFEKEILKLDEKVNICSMIFSGRFMRAFPVPGDQNNHWQSPGDSGNPHAGHIHQVVAGNTFAEQFYPAYISSLQHALLHDHWTEANQFISELHRYQQKNGGIILPSDSKVSAELLLNRLNIFSRLGKLYGLLGLFFLGLLFTSVFKPKLNMKWPYKITFGLLVAGFILHTVGLGLRWYVSGRAPWSNGYESMIYIAYTTALAGLIFSRKSFGGLAATSVLSATILMVAGLSWLDPEITPLVPVLKSYWLTIHVSMEAGSYGFLMLGAIIGVINLLLMVFRNKKNGENTNRMIKEMTYISEMTLIGGLFMISIGTYLGGVWANESWGRYWGWDAKETWALVTILVYSFILHMRFIPGLRSIYAFNVASLVGLASVMMTYFGVNYYLSGLHSYAAGDPIPIPPFVYYTAFTLIAISFLAYWRNRWYQKIQGSENRARL